MCRFLLFTKKRLLPAPTKEKELPSMALHREILSHPSQNPAESTNLEEQGRADISPASVAGCQPRASPKEMQGEKLQSLLDSP